MQTIHVVDISHYQSDPDFSAALAAGVVGVIHKATQGTSYTDPTFAARKKAAAAAGMPFASYHFLEAGNIAAQMAHYLDVVKPVAGERVIIDHEQSATLAELKQAVQYLFDAGLNLQVTVYSGSLIEQQLGKTHDAALALTSLWTPEYTSKPEPTWPTGTWPVWTLWQFTDKATVPGFREPVDASTFNGSAAACARWLAPAPTPAPSPTADKVVSITINAPPGVQVEVNGNTLTVR